MTEPPHHCCRSIVAATTTTTSSSSTLTTTTTAQAAAAVTRMSSSSSSSLPLLSSLQQKRRSSSALPQPPPSQITQVLLKHLSTTTTNKPSNRKTTKKQQHQQRRVPFKNHNGNKTKKVLPHQGIGANTTSTTTTRIVVPPPALQQQRIALPPSNHGGVDIWGCTPHHHMSLDNNNHHNHFTTTASSKGGGSSKGGDHRDKSTISATTKSKKINNKIKKNSLTSSGASVATPAFQRPPPSSSSSISLLSQLQQQQQPLNHKDEQPQNNNKQRSNNGCMMDDEASKSSMIDKNKNVVDTAADVVVEGIDDDDVPPMKSSFSVVHLLPQRRRRQYQQRNHHGAMVQMSANMDDDEDDDKEETAMNGDDADETVTTTTSTTTTTMTQQPHQQHQYRGANNNQPAPAVQQGGDIYNGYRSTTTTKNAALTEIPILLATTAMDDDHNDNSNNSNNDKSRKRRQNNTTNDNYIRLNLRNKSGSCRGYNNGKNARQQQDRFSKKRKLMTTTTTQSSSFGSLTRATAGTMTGHAVNVDDDKRFSSLSMMNQASSSSKLQLGSIMMDGAIDHLVDDYVDGILTTTTTATTAPATTPSAVETNASSTTTTTATSKQQGRPPNNSKSTKRSKSSSAASSIPLCTGHQQPCKLLKVKKSGPNKGRPFYVCPCPRGEQCQHFVWADDTLQVVQETLLKNQSLSGFIARQVASYMSNIKCLTVPELKQLAQQKQIEYRSGSTKAQLIMRLSIHVRDEIADATKHLEIKSGMDATDNQHPPPPSSEKTTHDDDDDKTDASNSLSGDGGIVHDDDSDGGESCASSSCSASDDEEELELIGEKAQTGGIWGWKASTVVATNDPTSCHGMPNVHRSSPVKDSDECGDDHGHIRGMLRKLFGFTTFRDGQEWAINRCLNQERSLLVAPTGFGKSLCYALPAALLDGVCIIVSPLLSLIQDQIRVLPARLPAVTLSGSMSSASMAATLDDIARGRIKLIFVSPERLTSASFRRLFRPRRNIETKSYASVFPTVSLFCVDEAHCLSQWAHNFRPSYLRLRSVMEMINPKSVLAITATAGPRVVDDICRMLCINNVADDTAPAESSTSGVLISRQDRDNIDVRCVYLRAQEERLTAVRVRVITRQGRSYNCAIASRTLQFFCLSQLLSILSRPTTKKKESVEALADLNGCLSTGSVIVYVWRQRDAEVVAENIQASGIAGGVVVYHGGMDATSRTKAQSKFMRGKVRICVATIAFGMGINKADVAGVIHMYLSSSPEHYIQEIGRAGRDGSPARAIALVLKDEVLIRHSLAHSDLVSKSQVRAAIVYLRQLVDEAMSCLPADRSRQHPIHIAFPVVATVIGCDCKVETVETILSLLEQRRDKDSLLVIEGISYDKATIAPRRTSLENMSKLELVAKSVLCCARVIEQQHSMEEPSRDLSSKQTKLGDHAFGMYSFSVAQCSNCLGPDAEPRHVFSALRRLETDRVIDFALDTEPQDRVLSVRLTSAGMDLFLSQGTGSIDELVDETEERLGATISAGANKVVDLNHIMCSISKVRPAARDERDSSVKSKSLLLFQTLTSAYFECEGRGAMLAESDNLPEFSSDISVHALAMDAQTVLSLLLDIQDSVQGTKLIRLGDPSVNDYTALTIAKFLHGIAPATVPLTTIRHHHLFGKMQDVQFNALLDAVSRLL